MDRFVTEYHSQLYSNYRPQTPPAVFDYIVNYLGENTNKPWKVVLDVGCGSGQSTRLWAQDFIQVYGFDVSESQIHEAFRLGKNPPNVQYAVSAAESLPVPDNFANLIIVSQAIHWFDKPKFFAEAERVLVPGGAIAIYSYILVDPMYEGKSLLPVYELTDKHPLILPYIPDSLKEEQKHGLRDLVMPFEDRRRADDLTLSVDNTMGYFMGLVRSRSAFEKLRKASEESAERYLADIEAAAKKVCSQQDLSDEEFLNLKIRVDYHYAVEIGRKKQL